MSELEMLPEGWEIAKIMDVIQPIETIDPSTNPEHEINYLDIGSIDNQLGLVIEPKTVAGRDAPSRARQVVKPGDVLFSTVRPYLRAIAQVPQNIDSPIASTGFCVLRGSSGISQKYLFFYSRSELFMQQIIPLQRGVSYPAVRSIDILTLPFPIAPENEQTRIVEKLEELLSDLDNGVAELKAAQIKLTQYRQSLLKSAVEGSLTAEWRDAQGRANVAEGRTPGATKNQPTETGQQLLQRILKERRQRWEQQKLAEFKEKGKKPPKDWKLKYPEPVQPDTSELPELPEGWVWASLDMLGDIVSGVTKGTKRKNPVEVFETAYLRVANVQRGYLDLSEIKTIPATQSDIDKYTLHKGDILFNEGGDRDKLGRGWVWYGEVENCIHQNHVFRLRLYLPEVVPELISHYGNTFGKIWFQNAGKQTTNLASINKGILQSFPIPLSPYVEQAQIMEMLTTEIDKVDRQIIAVDTGLKETDAQRKNILKDAFSGKLVPQDPNDEPASVLLEKIKAERLAQAKLPKPKRAKKKANNKASIMDTLFDVLKAKGDWMDAQEAFRACGVSDGTETDRIEELYAELRKLDKAQKLLCERHGDYDMLKLKGE